jgi:hypothetical protein
MIPHISLLELLEGVKDSVGAEMNGGKWGQVTERAPLLGGTPPPAGLPATSPASGEVGYGEGLTTGLAEIR